jgi:hypothetical protein
MAGLGTHSIGRFRGGLRRERGECVSETSLTAHDRGAREARIGVTKSKNGHHASNSGAVFALQSSVGSGRVVTAPTAMAVGGDHEAACAGVVTQFLRDI